MFKFTINSIYGLILFLLIATSVGGGYLFDFEIFGINLYLFRIVLGASLLFLIISKKIRLYDGPFSRFVFFVFCFWLLYGLLSLFWTPSKLYALKEIINLSIGIITYFVFYSLKHNYSNFFVTLEKSWVAVYICVLVVLVIEISTQNHLVGDYYDKLISLGFYHTANYIPVFTFGNPNHLAIYLCISFALSLFYVLRGSNFFTHCSILLVSVNILLIIDSRLSLLYLFLSLICLLFLYFFRFVRKTTLLEWNFFKVTFLIIGFVGSVLMNYNFEIIDSIEPEVISEIKAEEESKKEMAEETIIPINKESESSSKSILVVRVYDSTEIVPLHLPDQVFPIEKRTQYKMIYGDTLNLVVFNLESDSLVQSEIYPSSQKNENFVSIILLLFLAIMLFSYSIINYKFNVFGFLLLVSTVVLFIVGIFSRHTFDRPNGKFLTSVLVDEDILYSDGFEIRELNLASVDARTSELLKEGKVVKTVIIEKASHVIQGSKGSELSSSSIRKNLFFNGLDYLKNSNYFGAGAGSYKYLNSVGKGKRPVGSILNPHNFVIEIIAQYGVIVFMAIFGMFVWVIVFFVKCFTKKKWSNRYTLVIIMLICLLFMGNANSTFIPLSLNWILIAIILIVSDGLINEQKKLNDSKNNGI